MCRSVFENKTQHMWIVVCITGKIHGHLIYNTTIIDLSTSHTCCCCTTLGKLIFALQLSSPCMSDDRAPAVWNSKIYSFLLTYGLPVALILIELTIEYGAWCRIACIRHQCGTWPWVRCFGRLIFCYSQEKCGTERVKKHSRTIACDYE